MKPITLDEYKEAGEEFFPKYFYVAKELGEGAKMTNPVASARVLDQIPPIWLVGRAR